MRSTPPCSSTSGPHEGIRHAHKQRPSLRRTHHRRRPRGTDGGAVVAAVLDPADSIESHVQDTLVAGAGLCDEHAVRAIVTQAPAAIEWLRALGVPFDTLAGSDALHLGREGGHQHRRIAHVADHTGQAVHAAVVRAARQRNHITLWEGHTALELLASSPPAGARTWHLCSAAAAADALGGGNRAQRQPPVASTTAIAHLETRCGSFARDEKRDHHERTHSASSVAPITQCRDTFALRPATWVTKSLQVNAIGCRMSFHQIKCAHCETSGCYEKKLLRHPRQAQCSGSRTHVCTH